jgi:hypothetical protein
LGIAWYDTGSDPEFNPKMMVGTIEARAMLEFACGGDSRK